MNNSPKVFYKVKCQEIKTDLLIAGGGVGGCACALAACANGLNVVMTEESDWIGGQFTSQATPPDEHGWIEKFGATARYRQFRESVRRFYRQNYPLKTALRNDPFLNPGNGWVSPLCAEPRVFLRVFEQLLAEFQSKGNLRILLETVPVESETNGDKVENITFFDNKNDSKITVSATYFVDATELGELLPLTGTEFVSGSESRLETGEPSAKETADPHNSQAFSMCFAMSHHKGEDWTIERPANYSFWREFVPNLSPPWSGKLLSLDGLSPRTREPISYCFDPENEPSKAFSGLWTYRRILDKENFADGAFASDITLVNYPQIDYLSGELFGDENAEKNQELKTGSLAEAKEQSLSFLYYLQTELGFKGLKIRPDVVGTNDGLAKMPYVREARRIKAELTILEQHVSAKLRPDQKLAEKFADSVGIGFYRIDLHPTARGDNYVDVESLPFRIPLGALLPQRMRNLLPAAKNIGTTHITNGCYRLHPIEWNIGQAVGELLAFCLKGDFEPHQVRHKARLLSEFQSLLVKKGFELAWPEDLILSEGDPHRHAM